MAWMSGKKIFHLHVKNVNKEIIETCIKIRNSPENLTIFFIIIKKLFRFQFTDPNPLSLRQHLYMGYHMGSGRLMQFESNWYANRYKIQCKWKDCPMADQPFTTLKAIYDHMEQDHYQLPPPPPEVPATDGVPPKRTPKHTMMQCRWVGCDGPRYPDAELLRQHVDQHFGGALRALWNPAESMVEVRRALSVLVQTPSQDQEPVEDEEEPLLEDDEDLDGWRLEWEYKNQQQQPAQDIIVQAQMEETPAPKRRGRKPLTATTPADNSTTNLLPEEILETEHDETTAGDETNLTPKKKTAVEAAVAAALDDGETPEKGDKLTPSTEIRRSARQKKPTFRFLEAKRINDDGEPIGAENDDELIEVDDDIPLELRKKARKLPRGRPKREKKDHEEHQVKLRQQISSAQDSMIVMDVSTEQKHRRMRRSFQQHVLFVPEARYLD